MLLKHSTKSKIRSVVKYSRIQPNRSVALRLRRLLLYQQREAVLYQNAQAITVPLEVHQVVLQVVATAIKLEEPTQVSARLIMSLIFVFLVKTQTRRGRLEVFFAPMGVSLLDIQKLNLDIASQKVIVRH